MSEPLELRMYFLVNYQLTGMQSGIQSGHAALEYAQLYFDTELYQDFIKNWKTWIVLNGGTTNTNSERLGTLNKHLMNLKGIHVPVSEFYEPDLGDQLTAIAFILDERVFDKKKYPDFKDYLVNRYSTNMVEKRMENSFIHIENEFSDEYFEWKELIGGVPNIFLREFIKPFRLA